MTSQSQQCLQSSVRETLEQNQKSYQKRVFCASQWLLMLALLTKNMQLTRLDVSPNLQVSAKSTSIFLFTELMQANTLNHVWFTPARLFESLCFVEDRTLILLSRQTFSKHVTLTQRDESQLLFFAFWMGERHLQQNFKKINSLDTFTFWEQNCIHIEYKYT